MVLQRWSKVGAILLIWLLCFGFAEVLTRLAWNGNPYYGYPPELYRPDSTRGYAYKPSYATTFTGAYHDIPFVTNSEGYRDAEHGPSKPGIVRVLALGDSVTVGAGVRENETYVAWLAREFSSRGQQVEFINTGVDGYQFDQELATYERTSPVYRPDIIILGVVLNDVLPTNVTAEQARVAATPSAWQRVKIFLTNNVRSVAFAYYVKNRLLTPANYSELYYARVYSSWNSTWYDRYRSQVDELTQETRAANQSLIVVIFPYTNQFGSQDGSRGFPQDQVRRAMPANVPVIDLLLVYDRADWETLYIAGDGVHPSAAGHALAGETIFPVLERVVQERLSER